MKKGIFKRPTRKGKPICESCEKIEKAHRESDEHYKKYLRASAELENYKKRKDKEVAQQKEFANEKLLKNLLPMIDSLEQTWLYMHGDKDEVKRKTVCENLEQILKQVDIFLESFGVKGFKVVGEEFDPHRHEALGALETSRHEEGIVLDVLQRGYMLKDRLLRPAAVLISKKK